MTPSEGTILTALVDWRDQQIRQRTLESGVLKDAHLNGIVRSGATTVDGIATELPQSAQWAAIPLADLIERYRGAATAPAHPVLPEPDAAAATAVEPEPDHSLGLGPADFPDNEVAGSGPVGGIEITATRDGQRYRWAATESEFRVTIYRVGSGDDRRPERPDPQQCVAVTTATEVVDRAPLDTAVRFVAVWRHVGDTVEKARSARPELVARGQLIAPVQDFEVEPDHDVVIGRWSAPRKTTRVRVYRIPHTELAAAGEKHRIFRDAANLNGFIDIDAEPGVRYHYRAISEVDAGDGIMLSEPVQTELTLAGDLTAIGDLSASARHSEVRSVLDLTWTTPPGGEVHIYRTAGQPPPVLREKVLPVESLASATIAEDARLSVTNRVRNPIMPGPTATTSQMSTVVWPSDWIFVYLTPVTVRDGQACVGATVTAVRGPKLMEHVRVIERCDEQVVTMAWPAAADEIEVYVAGKHIPVDTVLTQRPAGTIDRDIYVRDGGLHLPEPLPALGCRVHLVPVTFAGGHRILGTVTSVDYPGLLRVGYRLEIVTIKRRERWLHIQLLPEFDLPSAPPFALIHHPDRLPLSIEDGRCVESYHYLGNPGAAPVRRIHPDHLQRTDPHLVWRTPLGDLGGFVRLFADIRPEDRGRLAIVDPPVRTLRLSGFAGVK
ncbi:hypothetical protein [Nocardia sp. alder85J]|uniref:hypothetical protein n=1 Tax=Nocardia sp. alder85J TaxID=2862949 RepID=UPI001CD5F89C|nr:hypothetical protein [Nocardia sp. alder85J]MCX4090921.1 hypothetical protein [Nocardia sp. alder85J]